jgi:hypothetical protein
MILDITLKDNRFTVTIHKAVFAGPFSEYFRPDGFTSTREFNYPGVFRIEDDTFGFDGCLTKIDEDRTYVRYAFDMPPQEKVVRGFSKKSVLALSSESILQLRKFLMTIHVISEYRTTIMYYDKELFDTNAWSDQSLSFSIMNRGGSWGYSLSGLVHPWLKQEFASLTEKELRELSRYMDNETERFCSYARGENLFSKQFTVTNGSWFVQCSSGGVWVSCSLDLDLRRPNEFSSHNMDHSADQHVAFAAIIAMNTWLRNREVESKD